MCAVVLQKVNNLFLNPHHRKSMTRFWFKNGIKPNKLICFISGPEISAGATAVAGKKVEGSKSESAKVTN